MQRLILVVAVSWFAFAPVSVHAQGALYKWVDSRGVAHYTNTPTNRDAKTVDDALPPASNFQRPVPPVEPTEETAKLPTGASSTPAPAPNENPPQQAAGEPASEAQPSTGE